MPSLPGVGDEAPSADEADLFGAERHELDRACGLGPGEVRRDPSQPLDTGCVVDRARPVPHRVVVRADHDALVTCPGDARDDVPVSLAGDERPADDEPGVLPRTNPLAVRTGEECGRRRREVCGVREPPDERNRAAAEDRTRETALAHAPEAVGQLLDRALAHARMRVHARAGPPPLAVHPELRFLRVVAQERELLERGLEAELPERSSDGVRRPRGRLGPALAHTDRLGECVHQVGRPLHCASLPESSRR